MLFQQEFREMGESVRQLDAFLPEKRLERKTGRRSDTNVSRPVETMRQDRLLPTRCEKPEKLTKFIGRGYL